MAHPGSAVGKTTSRRRSTVRIIKVTSRLVFSRVEVVKYVFLGRMLVPNVSVIVCLVGISTGRGLMIPGCVSTLCDDDVNAVYFRVSLNQQEILADRHVIADTQLASRIAQADGKPQRTVYVSMDAADQSKMSLPHEGTVTHGGEK